MQYERTPLIIASREGHTAVVDLLVSKGAHVNDTDKVHEFCVHFPLMNGTFFTLGMMIVVVMIL